VEQFLGLFSILFGLCCGSFLNVVIYRLPRGQSVVSPRSHCPYCGKLVFWYENIPVLSYLVLRGKCSSCGNGLSLKYPLIELACGLLSLLLWREYFNLENGVYFYIFYFSVAMVFLCGAVIDFEHKIIPDSLNFLLLTMGLVYGFYTQGWLKMLLGASVGFSIPYGVTWIMYKWRGKIGMGGGDIKLFAVLGIILGPLGVYLNIILSCLLGSLFVGSLILLKKYNAKKPFAFGPYIYGVATAQIFFPGYFSHFLKYIGL